MSVVNPEIYYFGCIRQAGHYLFYSENRYARSLHSSMPPQPMTDGIFRSLDGGFCPPKGWMEGQYQESSVGAWLIISWWDFSVDSRPGSHSTFLGIGVPSHEALLAAAKIIFPEVFVRQKEPVRGPHPDFMTHEQVHEFCRNLKRNDPD